MTNSGEKHLPPLGSIPGLVGLEHSRLDPRLFQSVLLDPLAGVLHRPAKQVRARLVLAGHGYGAALSGERAAAPARVKLFARLLEEMHCGSLVVDDIQDDSEARRGAPALHRSHGLPLALNAGNWLYFWQLWQLRELRLPAERELALTRFCLDTYLRAHFGQALDVGYRADELPQEGVRPASLANMELKTGALLALALGGGALLAGAGPETCEPLLRYGRALGVYLQMFDDIGNVTNPGLGPKRFEDFRGRRLSWAWAAAASELGAADYTRFCALVRERRAEAAGALLEERGVLTYARAEARRFLSAARAELERDAPPATRATLGEIEAIEQLLTGAY